MSDTKISALTNYTPPLDADVLPIVDTANTTTKKVTWANIKATLKTYFDTLYPNVTLAGLTYITLAGQVITATAVNLATQVTGNLPVGNLNSGTSASGTTFWCGNGTWATPPANSSATSSAQGLVELATAAEITAGTATGSSGPLAITPDQLALSSPTFNGVNLTNISKLYSSPAVAQAGTSSTAEATLGTYSLAGGVLGTNNAVKIEFYLEISDAGAGGATYTTRIKYGSTTIHTNAIAVASAAFHRYKVTCIIAANGSVSAQTSDAQFIGNVGGATASIQMFNNVSVAETSSGALALAITGQNSQNNGSSFIKMYDLVITKIL